MHDTRYNHILLALLRMASNGERTLAAPFFAPSGARFGDGTLRLWTDADGDVYLEATDPVRGVTTLSTADSDSQITQRWLGVPCPDGTLGHGD